MHDTEPGKMNPVARSALRSILFNVLIPMLLLLIADNGARMVGLGLDKEVAAIAAEVIGLLLRAYMPNVVAPRPT